MALVTGVLSDFATGNLIGRHPTIIFEPSGPGMSDPNIYAPEPVIVVPVVQGGFSVDLQPNDAIHPATHYKVGIRWGEGRHTKLPGTLFVPSTGGRLADLLQYPVNPAAVWVGETPPENPTPGTWWYQPSTGELSEWSN